MVYLLWEKDGIMQCRKCRIGKKRLGSRSQVHFSFPWEELEHFIASLVKLKTQDGKFEIAYHGSTDQDSQKVTITSESKVMEQLLSLLGNRA